MKNLFVFLFAASFFSSTAQIVHKRQMSFFGSPLEISVVAKDTIQGNIFINAALAEASRIEHLISDVLPASPLSAINANAGIKPVKVDEELVMLIKRAIHFSRMTDGTFDISFASMDNIWKYDGSMKTMPTPEAIKKSVEKIGYEKIIVNNKDRSVFLKDKGMKLGLGGIGQGYIADRVHQLLLSMRCEAGMVNFSGDINAWGSQPDGKPWTVDIVNPLNHKVVASFPLKDSAVETSGTFEKYVTLDGNHYTHIIDPRTGYPAEGIVSVSVFAKTTEVADALSTGIFVLGTEAGLKLVNKTEGISCIIIDDKGKVHTSDNIDMEKYGVSKK
jgi:thiamine biosynthesis lipoprotein